MALRRASVGGGTVLQEFGQITDVDAGQGRHSAGLGDVHRAQQRPGLWLYSYGEEDTCLRQDHRMRAADWTARSPPAPRPHGSKHRTKIGQTGLTGRNLNRPKQIRF